MTNSDYVSFINNLIKEIASLPLPKGIIDFVINNVIIEQNLCANEMEMGLREQDKNERIAVITGNPKLHALFFDRLDVQALHTDAHDIPFEYKSRYLTYETSLFYLLSFILNHTSEQLINSGYIDRAGMAPLALLLIEKINNVAIYGHGLIPCSTFVNVSIRKYAQQLSKQYSINVFPVYPDDISISNDFEHGSQTIIQRTIKNLNIADEEHLEWKQISDFRKDKESRLAYINFLNYLRERWDIYDKDIFLYEIEKSYYEYNKSLKKHGIMTTLGFIKDLFSTEFVLPTAISSVASQILNPSLTPYVTGAFVVGSIVFNICKYKTDLKYEKPDTSIAWLIALDKQLR